MNILEQEDIIKGLPDQALMQEAQMPSGQVPQYLVVSEIQRRSDMRKRYKAEQEQMPQATVKEQVMQEGIMGAMPQMPPQMAMAPQMPQRMPQMPPQGIQQAMPPQMMSDGGEATLRDRFYNLDTDDPRGEGFELDADDNPVANRKGMFQGLSLLGVDQETIDNATRRTAEPPKGLVDIIERIILRHRKIRDRRAEREAQGIQQAMPPEEKFGGGVVRMDEGRQAQSGLNLDPLRERLGALGDTVKDIESSNRQTDSSGNVLRSVKGAVGLMQVMPATAAQPGYNVPSIFDLARRAGIEVNEDQVTFDREVLEDGKIKITPTAEAIAEADRLLENPRLNEAIGLRYLEAMVDEFDGDLDRIGIAYNAGPKVAERWDGNPESLIKETRDYIAKIKGSEDVVNARDSLVGLEQQDTPAEGSPEAQARVVEAIQRRRAATPPRSAEEQLLDMAGGRPMPVVGQGAPRESVSVTAPRLPAVSLDNAFDPTIAAPNISMPNLPPALPPEPELSFITPQGVRVNETLTPLPADARTQLLEMAGGRPLPVLKGQSQIENVNVTAPLFPPVGPFNNAYSSSVTASNVLLPETPLPTDGREPIASQLAKRTVDRYTDYDPVAPVFSEEGIFRAQGGVDSGVAALPTESDIADARSAYMGRTGMLPAGDARVQATDSAEVQSKSRPAVGFIPGVTNRDVGFGPGMVGDPSKFGPFSSLTPEGGPLFNQAYEYLSQVDDFTISGLMNRRAEEAAREKAAREGRLNISREDIPSMIPELDDYATLPGMEAPSEPESYQGPFSLDYLRQKNAEEEGRRFAQEANEKRTKGRTKAPPSKSDPKGKPDAVTEAVDALAGTPGNDKSNPANNPADGGLNFADLIADSRRQAMSNALIQLGAGIAGGDVSKGIAAAGQAATEGTQDARDLDMKRRLAEYEAGREDLRREVEDKQFDRRMSLEESKQDVLESQFGKKFDEQVRQFGLELRQKRDEQSALNLRARLNSVPDMINTIDTELMRLDGLGVDQNDPRYRELINNRKTISATYTTYMNELNDYEQNIRGMSYRERGFSLEGESTAPPSYLMRN